MNPCSKCNKVKNEDQFYTLKGVIMDTCKDCHLGYQRRWREAHKKRVEERKKRYAR